MSGRVCFYDAPTQENEQPTVEKTVQLSDEEARWLRKHLDAVKDWVKDEAIDRLSYHWDGDFTLSDDDRVYFFTYEYNIVYVSNQYFAEVSEEMMEYLKDISRGE